MNEVEKTRILEMVANGTLKPAEGAQLLAALAELPPAVDTKAAGKKVVEKAEKAKPKPKQPMLEVDMQRPDGSHYKVEVPPNLFPMFVQIAKVAIKESSRTAAQETWSGFKHIVHTKTNEVKEGVKSCLTPSNKTVYAPEVEKPEAKQFEARRQILQMVQNGRISADDASRLIQQLDALQTYQEQTAVPVPVKVGK